ncbi:hypothetical protein D1007_18914 [Hordeum vulgare]|nr:hypothetical protein D1007_18914 [Hordeum vulgare]
MSAALSALLNLDPEDLLEATSPLYNLVETDELVANMPAFDKWGLVPSGPTRSLGGSPVEVTSSSNELNDEDSEALKDDEEEEEEEEEEEQ